MREWGGQDGGRTEKKSNESDVLVEGAVWGLLRNLVIGKFSRIHKNDPS